MKSSCLFAAVLLTGLIHSVGQDAPVAEPPSSKLPAVTQPLGIPKPGPATDEPYAPQPILPGGIVLPLYPPGSPHLNQGRIRDAEQYNMSGDVHGRINSIVNIHGNGRHPGDRLPEGGSMSGGLTDRQGIPFGTWQYRFIDWFRDLGFLEKPGVETKAAKDIKTFIEQPPRQRRF